MNRIQTRLFAREKEERALQAGDTTYRRIDVGMVNIFKRGETIQGVIDVAEDGSLYIHGRLGRMMGLEVLEFFSEDEVKVMRMRAQALARAKRR